MKLKKRYKLLLNQANLVRCERRLRKEGKLMVLRPDRFIVKYLNPIDVLNLFDNSVTIHYSWLKLIEYQLSQNYLWIDKASNLSKNLFLEIEDISHYSVDLWERFFLKKLSYEDKKKI
jgi:hypothetical protein